MERRRTRQGEVAGPRSRDEMRRRHAMIKRRRRRRILTLTIAVFLLILMVSVIVLSVTVLFPVETIDLPEYSEETMRYTKEVIIEKSGLSLGDNLFRSSTKKAVKNIQQELPYIGSATVKRSFPSRINITVEYTEPMMYCEVPDGFALLDKTGKVLEVVSEAPADGLLFLSIGTLENVVAGKMFLTADSPKLTAFQTFFNAVNSAGITGLTKVELADESAIRATYKDRILIELGGMYNLESKVNLAQQAIVKEEERNEKAEGTLDLRYENKAYFAPK